jgi:hypothetical protein
LTGKSKPKRKGSPAAPAREHGHVLATFGSFPSSRLASTIHPSRPVPRKLTQDAALGYVAINAGALEIEKFVGVEQGLHYDIAYVCFHF